MPSVTIPPFLIERYAGSRLYDPARACYVALDELRRWEAQGVPFSVVDAETGEDGIRALPA